MSFSTSSPECCCAPREQMSWCQDAGERKSSSTDCHFWKQPSGHNAVTASRPCWGIKVTYPLGVTLLPRRTEMNGFSQVPSFWAACWAGRTPISKAEGLDTPPGHTLNKLCHYFLLFMNLDITGLHSKQVLSTCRWLNWAQERCQVTPVVMEYLSHVTIAVIYRKDHPQSPQSEPKAKSFSAWAK